MSCGKLKESTGVNRKLRGYPDGAVDLGLLLTS
jgi:hypothetical protein